MRRLFVTGVPVTGDEFVGRQKEIKEIKYLITHGQSVILTAPRRYGKTSLLLKILEELRKEGNYTSVVDIFSVTSLGGLAERIIEVVLENRKLAYIVKSLKESIAQALKQVEIKQVIEDFEFVLNIAERNRDEQALIEEALDFPQKFTVKNKKDLYFFYDEFGDIQKLNGESLIKLMRSKFQRHSNVCYLFAGSQESVMKEIFALEKSAFYRFGRLIYLGEIERKIFADYIQSRFAEGGIAVNQQIANRILDKTKGHPYYTQLVCQHIHYAVQGEKETVESDDVEQGYREALNSERTYFEKLWEELSTAPAQLGLLIEIVKGGKNLWLLEKENGINVSRTLRLLRKRGFIKKIDEGDYSLIDPLFHSYILDQL